MRAHSQDTLPLFRRLLAAGLAALVLALALLAAAPVAHKHLHDDADHDDHECAVVFLAQGVTFPPAIAAAPAAVREWREDYPAPTGVSHVARPGHLLPMKCGPPALA